MLQNVLDCTDINTSNVFLIVLIKSHILHINRYKILMYFCWFLIVGILSIILLNGEDIFQYFHLVISFKYT